MQRICTGLLCLLMIFVFGISFVVAGKNTGESEQSPEDMCVPMGVIVLEPNSSIEAKKAPVDFHHSKHFLYDCKQCHHKWKGNEQIVNCTTAECHDLLTPPKKPTKYLAYTDAGIKYYKYAFHQKCVGCHKEIKAQRKKMELAYQVQTEKLPKTGPTGCKECHPKE